MQDPAGRPRLSAPDHVGRGAELGALAAALGSPPAVVLVEGEPGVGKSRLLTEFFAGGHRLTPVIAACPPFRVPLTLGPIVDAIRDAVHDVSALDLSPLAGALRPLFAEWADLLPGPLEPAEDALAARHRTFRALAELLDRLGTDALVLDDAHWADDATLEFLLFLRARRPVPPSLVIAYRPLDLPANSLLRRIAARRPGLPATCRIPLSPLDVADTGRLMSSMVDGEPVSEAFAAHVHESTDGLPLAVEEVLHLIRDRGDLIRMNGEWWRAPLGRIQVPPSVRDATLERVARLGEDARAVIDAACVLAGQADEPALAAVTGMSAERAGASLAAALDAGLLRQGASGKVSFRHALAGRARRRRELLQPSGRPAARLHRRRRLRGVRAIIAARGDRRRRHRVVA